MSIPSFKELSPEQLINYAWKSPESPWVKATQGLEIAPWKWQGCARLLSSYGTIAFPTTLYFSFPALLHKFAYSALTEVQRHNLQQRAILNYGSLENWRGPLRTFLLVGSISYIALLGLRLLNGRVDTLEMLRSLRFEHKYAQAKHNLTPPAQLALAFTWRQELRELAKDPDKLYDALKQLFPGNNPNTETARDLQARYLKVFGLLDADTKTAMVNALCRRPQRLRELQGCDLDEFLKQLGASRVALLQLIYDRVMKRPPSLELSAVSGDDNLRQISSDVLTKTVFPFLDTESLGRLGCASKYAQHLIVESKELTRRETPTLMKRLQEAMPSNDVIMPCATDGVFVATRNSTVIVFNDPKKANSGTSELTPIINLGSTFKTAGLLPQKTLHERRGPIFAITTNGVLVIEDTVHSINTYRLVQHTPALPQGGGELAIYRGDRLIICGNGSNVLNICDQATREGVQFRLEENENILGFTSLGSRLFYLLRGSEDTKTTCHSINVVELAAIETKRFYMDLDEDRGPEPAPPVISRHLAEVNESIDRLEVTPKGVRAYCGAEWRPVAAGEDQVQ